MESIGYLGPRGTFSEEVVIKYFKDKNLIPCSTISDVITSLDNKKLDLGFVPIENSIEGDINTTLDMLIFDTDIKIIAEVSHFIDHNLISKRNNKEGIDTILSHPQAIGQCRKYIDKYFKDCEIRYTSSTAEAVNICNENFNFAAIGNKYASDFYKLNIVDSKIQDNINNETRFVLLGNEYIYEKKKTSMAFSTQSTNKPGELYKILDILALFDINMTKIVSRPAKNKLGTYVFYVDFEGSIDSENINDAIKIINKKTSFFKIIGSYSILKWKERWYVIY